MFDLSYMHNESEWVVIGQTTQSISDKYLRKMIITLKILQTSHTKNPNMIIYIRATI